mmetsp:Transcript_41478/g.67321  ORF Transcript_41478/g.67321 Transcript_41478/m.67321 type:complete len:145 (-) Transcript_41478:404-838(-)
MEFPVGRQGDDFETDSVPSRRFTESLVQSHEDISKEDHLNMAQTLPTKSLGTSRPKHLPRSPAFRIQHLSIIKDGSCTASSSVLSPLSQDSNTDSPYSSCPTGLSTPLTSTSEEELVSPSLSFSDRNVRPNRLPRSAAFRHTPQ